MRSEELEQEIDRLHAQIGVLTELCIALLRAKPYHARAQLLEDFAHNCGILAGLTEDSSAGAELQVGEIREMSAAIAERFRH